MSDICSPYTSGTQFGRKLFPSPRDNPGKYQTIWPLQRDIKRSISQYDHAEKVTICAQISARIPALSGAIRQKNSWAFPAQSWHPIFYGDYLDEGIWEEAAEDWLVHSVFPNALLGNTFKQLLKAIQVSGMDVDRHGRDLAVFSRDADNMPKMSIIPGTRIGNGNIGMGGWMSVTADTFGTNGLVSGYAVCKGGEFDGYRIYNGIIHDETDEPIAARVLGIKSNGKGGWQETYADYRLGFKYGAHLWSEYDWHGMGAPLPKMASAILKWLRKEEIDDLFLTGIANAASQTVIHKLAEGQDAMQALGDGMQMIEHTDSDGNKQQIYVSKLGDGSTKYIGSEEELEGLKYDQPHTNVQDFADSNLVECLFDYGWPYAFLDSGGTGRAATRLDCELANGSIGEKQSPGEERMFWFLKYALACGITYKKIPAPPAGVLDMPYRWTFGTPKEISVDAGNDVTAYLNMLRFGLTSQRIGASRWGYVKKRIDRDRLKESYTLIDQTKKMLEYAKREKVDLTSPEYQSASSFFWMPNANIQTPQPAAAAGAEADKTNLPPGKTKPEPAKKAE